MKTILKHSSTLFLKTTLITMCAVALAILIFALPNIYSEMLRVYPNSSFTSRAIIASLYTFAIPFYFVMFHAWKLLALIDKNKSFSKDALKSLITIKWASLMACIILMTGFVPFLYPLAQLQDAPGLLVIGFAFACVPLVVSVFAAILEKLFHNAMELKSENELTI